MHLAAQNGHVLIVKYLLELGANFKQVNAEGKTAVDFAKESLAEAKRKVKNEPLVKGSLLERLLVTEKILSEIEKTE